MRYELEASRYFFKISFILAIWAILMIFPFHYAFSKNQASPNIHFTPAAVHQTEPISSLEQRLIKQGLINVARFDPTIMVDLKYASDDNFMNSSVYGDLTCAYLYPEPALMLILASRILRDRHPELRILVGDAVRPRSVQHKMWDLVVGTSQQHYVANPFFGSMHNYGAAVDVTLYNVETGEELDMGTSFDYFGPRAQPLLEEEFLRLGKLSREQIANRLILREVMVEAGWHPINIEWWHFNAFCRDYIRENFAIVE